MVTEKRPLIVVSGSPLGGTRGRDAVDLILTAGAFDLDPAVLFRGEGVELLRKNQQHALLGGKDLAAMLQALPLYDISRLFADAEALAARGLDETDLALPVKALSAPEVAGLFNTHQPVISL